MTKRVTPPHDLRPTEYFDPRARSPGHVRKMRGCLRCDARFMSSWAGERICSRCRERARAGLTALTYEVRIEGALENPGEQ